MHVRSKLGEHSLPLSEEWETRKKKEITTTRQIETRVKRQVVLEDGEVVVDSGPLVTTNTTEDVEQQEHTTQEVRPSRMTQARDKIFRITAILPMFLLRDEQPATNRKKLNGQQVEDGLPMAVA